MLIGHLSTRHFYDLRLVANFATLLVWISNMAQVRYSHPDVADFLTKKQTTDRDLAADWAQLEELYNKKQV